MNIKFLLVILFTGMVCTTYSQSIWDKYRVNKSLRLLEKEKNYRAGKILRDLNGKINWDGYNDLKRQYGTLYLYLIPFFNEIEFISKDSLLIFQNRCNMLLNEWNKSPDTVKLLKKGVNIYIITNVEKRIANRLDVIKKDSISNAILKAREDSINKVVNFVRAFNADSIGKEVYEEIFRALPKNPDEWDADNYIEYIQDSSSLIMKLTFLDKKDFKKYPLGRYRTEDIDKTITTFCNLVLDNLSKSATTAAVITGEADAYKIDTNKLRYDGRLGKIRCKEFYIDSNDALNNKELAFLRAYNGKVILENITHRKNTVLNTIEYTNDQDTGAEFRKVIIVVTLFDYFKDFYSALPPGSKQLFNKPRRLIFKNGTLIYKDY
ncbi:MAG TPA: hypothetical protein VD908_15805 [Cytophagales bacterium]|nr:hypothetical protein [Cytophagales bacterium]